MAVRVEYTSSACNRSPQALDWGQNNVIAYGACNAVVLYDPEANGGSGAVIHTLVNHSARVNCVRWARRKSSAETTLLSTSVDKTVTIWTKEGDRFVPGATLAGHESAVTTADALYTVPAADSSMIVASAGGDFFIRVWEVDAGFTTRCVQEINLKGNFAMDVRMCFLPSTSVPLLAYGGNDMMIHCYYRDSTAGFLKCHTLHGHEDWVRGIAFETCADNSIFIASCSQDSVIRIWKILPNSENESVNSDSAADEIKLQEATFTATVDGSAQTFAVGLETVLSGHEGWVYSISWCPVTSRGEDGSELHSLLSASMDKTVVVWEPDTLTGLWLDKARFGDIGGNTLGFLGAVFGPDGTSILGQGFHGSLHIWRRQEGSGDNLWQTSVSLGGHFDKVEDIAWAAGGEYLLTCSSDQTTRLHAPWVKPGGTSWKEIARPQVHGHDLGCIASTGRLQFVSGAEEKVLRAFEGTRNFVDNFKRLCGVDLLHHSGIKELAEGASVPSLGLSNKAVYENDLTRSISDEEQHPKNQFPEFYFTPVVLTEPPTEEDLLQNTLWTEVRKLYGHGYELFTLASSHSGKLIASACKASTQQHASILLWDTATWKQVGELVFHNLTITQMEFSPDDSYLLSVSRDRSWCIHEISADGNVFNKIAFAEKKAAIHQRIIWSCAWSHDGLYFATASRDKKVVIWGWRAADKTAEACLGPFESKAELTVEDSATAVTFAPGICSGNRYLVAIGLEKGIVHIYEWNFELGWALRETLQQNFAHHLSVRRLKFCPRSDRGAGTAFELASCGDDHMVRVYNIPFRP
uniref:Elongator complex protein 2 n=1 Tax=Amblyomma aureolatum TaxID=187763 RepID=A0A1E1XGG7_9ACAR